MNSFTAILIALALIFAVFFVIGLFTPEEEE